MENFIFRAVYLYDSKLIKTFNELKQHTKYIN